jgi:hypothetical protein
LASWYGLLGKLSKRSKRRPLNRITGCPGKHVLFPECIKGLTFDVPPSAAFRSEKHEDSSDDKR